MCTYHLIDWKQNIKTPNFDLPTPTSQVNRKEHSLAYLTHPSLATPHCIVLYTRNGVKFYQLPLRWWFLPNYCWVLLACLLPLHNSLSLSLSHSLSAYIRKYRVGVDQQCGDAVASHAFKWPIIVPVIYDINLSVNNCYIHTDHV